jgi:hypothetical protein
MPHALACLALIAILAAASLSAAAAERCAEIVGRIAAAEPRATSYADDAAASVGREAVNLDPTTIQELWIYKAASDGTPVGDSGYFAACTSCVKYTWDTTTKAFVRAAGSPDWPATSQNACIGDANHDSVGVYLRINHKAVTKLFFATVGIKEYAVMRLEPMSSTVACK